MLFVIIFISPLYFLIRKKWLGFIVNLCLYILSLFTIFLFGLGLVFWGLGVAHAFWEYHKESQERQAVLIAEKMVSAQKAAISEDATGG